MEGSPALSAAPRLWDPSCPGAPSRGHRSGLPAETIASPCHLPKAVARPQSAGLAQTAWCPAQPQTRQCSSRPVETGSPGGLQPPLSRCFGSSPLEPLRFHHPQPEDKAGGRGKKGGDPGEPGADRPLRDATAWAPAGAPARCRASRRGRASSLGLGAKASPVAGALPAPVSPHVTTDTVRTPPPRRPRRESAPALCALGAASSPGAHSGPSSSAV